MKLTDELIALITEKVGRFNVDIFAGWEAGMQGRERIAGRLFERLPPNHFAGSRLHDWLEGRRCAAQYRQSILRTVSFYGMKPDGTQITVRRKGWTVDRSSVVSQMERDGVTGNVDVYYTENGTVKRKVLCCI
jgi:hypothetical protein